MLKIKWGGKKDLWRDKNNSSRIADKGPITHNLLFNKSLMGSMNSSCWWTRVRAESSVADASQSVQVLAQAAMHTSQYDA